VAGESFTEQTMSIQKILLSVAGVLGLGSLHCTRDKKEAPAPVPAAWLRASRLAEKQDHPLGLVVDGDYVYFATGGFEKADNAVKRVPVGGGAVETLASGDFVVSGHLTTDEGFVYWTNEWPGTVMRVAKTGGKSTTLLDGQTRPMYVALDDKFVYFTTYAKEAPGGQVARVAKLGGAVETLATGHPYLSGLVVDEQAAYWTSPSGLWKQAKSGGAATRLSPEKQHLTKLCGDAGSLYFYFRSTDFDQDFAVGRIAKSGGEITKLTPPAEWNLQLGLSDTHVYFFQHGAGHGEYALQRVGKSGGAPETVDVGTIPSGYLAIRGGNGYFTDIDTVYRLPK
jgi:hypothetical protein